jgi:chitinase
MKLLVLTFLLLTSVLIHSTHGQQFVIGCYFTNWAQHRQALGRFLPSHIDPSLCTHLYYAFANIDMTNRSPHPFEVNDVKPSPSTAPVIVNDVAKPGVNSRLNGQLKPAIKPPPPPMSMYEQFNMLKHKNPQMKTLLSLGGASVNATEFRAIFEPDKTRREFIRNTIKYLRKYRFDGLDLDWEFPETETDRRIFSLLVRDYRLEFQNEAFITDRARLLLTAAVAAHRPKIEAGYDIKEIAPYLDLINLMSYDYHGRFIFLIIFKSFFIVLGSWNSYTGFNSPLYPRSTEKGDKRLLNQQATVDTWIDGGCPASKLVLGLGMYGRTFQLKQKKNMDTKPYAPSKGSGHAGNYTASKGFLSYYEICYLIKTQKWHTEYDKEQQVPYAYKDDQWVSFDNQESIEKKCHYVAERRLAGAMIWSLDFDDFNGAFCGQGKYPLLTVVKKTLDRLQGPTTPIRIHKTTQPTLMNNGNLHSYSVFLLLIYFLFPIFIYHFI